MQIDYHAYPKTFHDTGEAEQWILNAFPGAAICVNESNNGYVHMTWDDSNHQHFEMDLKPATERVLVVAKLH